MASLRRSSLHTNMHFFAFARRNSRPGSPNTGVGSDQDHAVQRSCSSLRTIDKRSASSRSTTKDDLNGTQFGLPDLDNGCSPSRRHREGDSRSWAGTRLLLMFESLGTATNAAVHASVQRRKVPATLIATGASKSESSTDRPSTIELPGPTAEPIVARVHPADEADPGFGVPFFSRTTTTERLF